MSFKQITRIRFFYYFYKIKDKHRLLYTKDLARRLLPKLVPGWGGDRALVLGHGSIAIGHFVIK